MQEETGSRERPACAGETCIVCAGLARTIRSPFALFALLAVVVTWPLALHFDEIIDCSPVPSDAGVHIRKVDEALARVRAGGPLFSFTGADRDYAISHTYVLSGMAAVGILGMDPVVFYNLTFVVSLALSGLLAFLLAREILGDGIAAFLAGALFLATNFLISEYRGGHTHVMQTPWIPLTLFAIERILAGGRPVRFGLLLGLASALQVYSSAEYAAFLSAFSAVYLAGRCVVEIAPRLVKRAQPAGPFVRAAARRGAGLALGAATALVLSWPYLAARLCAGGRPRTFDIVYLNANAHVYTLYRWGDLLDPRSPLTIGWVAAALAAAGAVVLAARIREPRLRRALALLPAVGFAVLAMRGLAMSDRSAWRLLHDHWPFIKHCRVPFRFFPFAQLGIAIVAAVPLVPRAAGSRRRLRAALAAALIVLVLALSFGLSPFYANRRFADPLAPHPPGAAAPPAPLPAVPARPPD